MLKSTTMFTYEIDSPQKAVQEIMEQLSSGPPLLKNTVGIVMCDVEFIDTGVLKAVCQALPFRTVGATTTLQAVNGEAGPLILTIMVLTSDDISFEPGMTDSVRGDLAPDATRRAYEATQKQHGSSEPPAMIFMFPPLHCDNSGDEYVTSWEAVCGKVPLFGMITIEDDIKWERCVTILNGDVSRDRQAFILVYGEIKPRFFVGAVQNKRALPYTGVITKAEGHRLLELNDIHTAEYFESIGLAKDGTLDSGVRFVPFMIDFKNRADYDGVSVARVMVYLDEDGAGVCRGSVETGAIFSFGTCDPEDAMATAKQITQHISTLTDAQAIFICSCYVRKVAFGLEPFKEANMIVDTLPKNIPYMLFYAGGEFCPTTVTNGQANNYFHNFSFIACVL